MLQLVKRRQGPAWGVEWRPWRTRRRQHVGRSAGGQQAALALVQKLPLDRVLPEQLNRKLLYLDHITSSIDLLVLPT